jgi:hypothetical protein
MMKAIIVALTLVSAQPAWAETIHSLGQIQGQLKTPQAQGFFAEQMQGKPAPDGLGVHLPAILSAAAVTSLVEPASNGANPALVGAKPWPGQPDLYVAIVCTGGAAPLTPGELQCARPDPGETQPPLHVYLAVIEAKDGTPPRLVARSEPVDGAMHWNDSGLPRQPMAADDASGGVIQPDRFDRFDLAPYKVAPGQPAFGLRASWTESYSGGGANFTGLCLFTMEGDRLKQVLAVPMSAYSDVAGDWHQDQTRDHDITDAANVLVVTSHSTDGHFDLLVKGLTGHWRQLFRWSASAESYKPAKD